ncbi:PepSY domain-containing protein [Paracoccus actinidiae]|uniref:PepSY domain-containing protein n=1 Tax=Paracoccus actinidiae TaxID=3064531 RepID=UPI0027D1F317|nr:PepSY domain-containing protein [Paracoccus sp. M09]
MRKTLTILAFLAVLPARAAFADDDCFVPMSQWLPRGAVEELAAANGWTVRRIKIDDGCYEIDGRDRADRRVEVKVHPGTLQVIKLDYEDGQDRDGPRRSGQRDK